MKRTLSIIAIAIVLGSSATAAHAATSSTYNPNAGISSGNTYGGLNISGIGGAIASCANVGNFLVNGASSLLGKTDIGQKAKAAYSVSGSSDKVEVSDKAAQDKLDTINRTSQCLDGIAYAVAKNTLAQVTNKTVNWVNTGLNGSPLYVQNAASYLQSIQNKQLSSFLGTVQTTDPIFGNALKSVLTLQLTGASDGRINTSLNTSQSKSYNSFMSDFTSGGWDALLNPANNPIGAFFNAADTVTDNITTQKQSATNEIQRNNGFLDMKQCVKYDDSSTSTDSTSTAIKTGLSNAGPKCLVYQTITPGSIIANQVATITSSPTRQLEYADKINEVLGNFFDGFVNNLLQKGLRGSSTGKAVNFGFGSEGDNTLTDSNGNDLTQVAGASLGYTASSTGKEVADDFDISRPQELRAIIQTQKDFLNRVKDSQIALNRVVPTIGALDYCIPGPNPRWREGTDSNWQSFLGAVQQADPNAPSLFGKVLGALDIGGIASGLFNAFISDAGKNPPIWTFQSMLTDKVTGGGVAVTRVLYEKDKSSTDESTGQVTDGLDRGYKQLLNELEFYGENVDLADFSNPVGLAFRQAALGDKDPGYVDGFLSDAYTQTASLVGYNKTASSIDTQYDQYISDTENNIRQMELIRQEVNSIVATAKADYIKNNPTVNLQCLNAAYVIDNSAIVPVARQESDAVNPLVQHAADSSSIFYGTQAI